MDKATRDEAKRWIAEAEKDLKDAQMLLRYESYYPLCRLAYLATEKAMRGILLVKGQHVADPTTLASLRRLAEVALPELRSLTAMLRPLELFEPAPADSERGEALCSLPLYGRQSAREALTHAGQAVTTIKQWLGDTT